MTSFVEIVASGLATTVQDRGRSGYAHLGVSMSGAVDLDLAALVNRLVGNRPDAAVLETCGGLTIKAAGALLIAGSRELTPISVSDGRTYTLDAEPGRLWQYLAIRGGLDVERVLGSRSTDTLSGLGPLPIEAGNRLAIGGESDPLVATEVAPLRARSNLIHVSEGPRTDWFTGDWLELLTRHEWAVSASSRVGVRLEGMPILLGRRDQLASEGLIRGAIQVLPDGNLIMMSSDHPTTGGYPVIAVVDPDCVASIAQRAPGTKLRFNGLPIRR